MTTEKTSLSFHVFYQWVSPKYKEGTVTSSRHDEYCSSMDEVKFILERERQHPPSRDMKMHYLIQEEMVKVIEKGIKEFE